MLDYIIKQTGEKETFQGGAQRDSQKGKPRYDLIPPLALQRVADLYTKGAEHYGDRNWEKGMPFSRIFGSLLRHAYQFSMGETDEDHLAAIVFNALAIMHFQEENRTDLDDMSVGRPKEKRGDVVVTCPQCEAFFRAPGGLPEYGCFHCGLKFKRPEKNLEKPLTFELPPPKIDKIAERLSPQEED